jgi:hypothetical protein
MQATLKAAGLDFRHVVFINPYLTGKIPMGVMNRGSSVPDIRKMETNRPQSSSRPGWAHKHAAVAECHSLASPLMGGAFSAEQRRPLHGNPASDRILRGPDCNRHSRVCADASVRFTGLPRRYHSPVGRPRAQVKERAGRSTPFSSFAMSSGRLFLDRVGRRQSPSPLHRRDQNNLVARADRTTYHRTVNQCLNWLSHLSGQAHVVAMFSV